jgi:hypothetical protein
MDLKGLRLLGFRVHLGVYVLGFRVAFVGDLLQFLWRCNIETNTTA